MIVSSAQCGTSGYTVRKTRRPLHSRTCLSRMWNLQGTWYFTFFLFVFVYTTLHTIVTILSFFRLLECRPKLLNYNIDIGNFRYAKYPVIIGAHSGNHFDIMLRDLAPRDGSSDEQLEGIVSAALDDIKENGFINYFGQQRYGVCDTLPLIGLAILRKDMVCLI